MLKNFIKEKMFHQLSFSPTDGQKLLIETLIEMLCSSNNQQLTLVKGYAGTGKTSVIASFVRTLKEINTSFVLMAPTGRAAKILGAYSHEPAYTVHKKIYRQKSFADGMGTFDTNYNSHHDTLFIVDEASMISQYSTDVNSFGSGNLLDDLIKFVYNDRNCRLILLGDTAQLPPIGKEDSPALCQSILKEYGLNVVECELTEVVRQAQESGILLNATIVRNMISNGQTGFPSLKTASVADVEHVNGSELIETISDAYDRYGMEETIIVCRSNKQSNRYNQGIRNQILFREDILNRDDLLMIVRNNYFWIKDAENISFIANGDIARVIRIRKFSERYDFRFAEVDLCLPDYLDYEFRAIIMLDSLCSDTASISEEQNRRLYTSVAEDYSHITNRAQRYKAIKEDPYFNALQVKYAYAVTCHKAQGGQWGCVFIDQANLTIEMMNKEYLRWLYTAITRATEKLYLVNFRQSVGS